MQIYLVGGAVRDQLLNYPVRERDWVVVGATPQDMLAMHYQPVGRDFPVFLHPDTKEEYALARTERKTAPGYRGFQFHASRDVTLEDDLRRRDLTINAMAQDADGHIIDPYHGRADLENRILRHVSPAFAEDPVRILRVARLAARYHHLGFRIAEETLALMEEMVTRGEVDALVAERVWQEMYKALKERHPEVFISVLRDCTALHKILPEIDCLFGVPQPAQYHPEIDTGIHTLMVVRQASLLTDDACTRFAALTHDLGKGATPADVLPGHRGHEEAGVSIIKDLCKRLRIPNDFRDLAVITSRFHLHAHRTFELKPKTLLKTLEQLDGLRKPERFEQFLIACTADMRGRKNHEHCAYRQADFLRAALEKIRTLDIEDIKQENLSGQETMKAIQKRRLHALRTMNKDDFLVSSSHPD